MKINKFKIICKKCKKDRCSIDIRQRRSPDQIKEIVMVICNLCGEEEAIDMIIIDKLIS